MSAFQIIAISVHTKILSLAIETPPNDKATERKRTIQDIQGQGGFGGFAFE